MTANDYQKLAWETAKPFYKVNNTDNSTFKDLQLCTAILALAGEAGELANKLKKMIERGGSIDYKDKNILIEELGDVQWYVAHAATLLEVKLDDVMGLNVAKLRERYGKDGMTSRGI